LTASINYVIAIELIRVLLTLLDHNSFLAF